MPSSYVAAKSTKSHHKRLIDQSKEYKLYTPTGYTANVVATLDPAQLATGLVSVEALYPQSSLVALRVELSSVPVDIDVTINTVNTTLAANGILNGVAFLDGNAVMVMYNTSPADSIAIHALTASPTSPLNLLLPIIGIIAFIVFMPALSSMISQIINLVVMFVMIRMMAGMMKGMGPNPAAESIAAGQDKIIAGAKKYVKIAIVKGKPYAEKAAPYAKQSFDELSVLASQGVDWAKKAYNKVMKSAKETGGEGADEYVGGVI